MTLGEASAAGLPVVACDTPVVRETVNAAAWVPVKAGPQEVARALLAAAEQGKKSCMSLIELEKRYSLERMVEEYEAFLGALAKRAKGSAQR